MSKFFKNTAFKIGLAVGIILFLLLQLYDYILNLRLEEEISHLSSLDIDVIRSWGLPFPMYYGERIFLTGLIGNIVVAIAFSFIPGLVFNFLWSKMAARKLK